MVTVRIFIAAMALICAPLGAAWAETTPTTATPTTDSPPAAGWQVQCYDSNGARQCEAAQSVILPGNPTPLAQAALGWMTKDAPMLLTVVVPPDVSLAAPLVLTLADGGVVTLPWARCRPGGCFAMAELTKDQLATLTANGNGSAQMAYTDSSEAAMTLRLPLEGLTLALQALDSARAQ